MANQEQEKHDGPKLVWTFPLITRIQTGSRFLDIGSNVNSLTSQGKLRSSFSQDEEQDDDEDYSDPVSDIQDDIDSVRESRDLSFESHEQGTSLEDAVVEIQDETFVPLRTRIVSGQSVTWINKDDSVHRVASVQGVEFDSGQIEPGESYEHVFNSEATNIYIDTITGADAMSGAIIVGDSESPETLPSEAGDATPGLFSESDDIIDTPSMSTAAEDKEEMDVGFDS